MALFERESASLALQTLARLVLRPTRALHLCVCLDLDVYRVACFPTRGVLADALASPDTTVHTHSGRDMYYPCNDVFVVLYVKPHLL